MGLTTVTMSNPGTVGTYGTVGTEVGTMVPWYLPRERNLQRYQLWYVLGSDELGAVSAQCRVGIKEIKREKEVS